MKHICIIIARGGSKRLYRKNVKMFCGKPLVEWSIIQCKTSHLIYDTFLSTDDDEIAEIGERNGIKVIRRPDWKDADMLAANPVVQHALLEIEKMGVEHETHTTVLPTAPLRLPADFDLSIMRYAELKRIYPKMDRLLCMTNPRETMISEKINSYRTKVVLFDKAHNYLGEGVNTDVIDSQYFKDNNGKIRYDYEVDDQIDTPIFRRAVRAGGREYSYRLCKWFQGYDIDDIDQFQFCELLMERYILKGRGEKIYWDYKKSEVEAIRRAMEEIEK